MLWCEWEFSGIAPCLDLLTGEFFKGCLTDVARELVSNVIGQPSACMRPATIRMRVEKVKVKPQVGIANLLLAVARLGTVFRIL